MLHGIKLAISGHGGRSIMEADQRVRETDRILNDLQRWFPQLQAAFEDNEKTWARLGYNMCTISKTAQEIYDESHAMHHMLHGLFSAGESILKPSGGESLQKERNICNDELRAFNDGIRQLRALQRECVTALRDKEYYTSKVETIRVNENKKKSKLTDREAERRLRNEEKLSDCTMQVNFKVDKLQTELEKILNRKEDVMRVVLQCYVELQNFYFGRNPVAPVVSLMSRNASPKGLQEVAFYGDATEVQTAPLFYGAPNQELPMPPRAPSPPLRAQSVTGSRVHRARSAPNQVNRVDVVGGNGCGTGPLPRDAHRPYMDGDNFQAGREPERCQMAGNEAQFGPGGNCGVRGSFYPSPN